MYKCLECNYIFEKVRVYVERHGLDSYPYEVIKGCPKCLGNYEENECEEDKEEEVEEVC